MTIYIETEFGEQCTNPECDDFRSWEQYDFDEVKTDAKGDYVICKTCGEKIYLED